MTLARLSELALERQLGIFGVLHTIESDGIGDGTLVLLGPEEPGFWPAFRKTPEWRDKAADPLDRWSARVTAEIAAEVGGTPYLPFGEPAHPFMTWAIRSGRAWSSPVHLLVHERAGLMVSYRGAVFLPERLPLDPAPERPCETCETRPCLDACPVDALTSEGYDLSGCHDYLDTEAGADCMTRGCSVRRACPLSRTYGRMEEQSAFHMERFHP